jgi:uncharacterized protein (DUF4415 family)
MRKVAAEPYREIDFSKAKRGAVSPLEPGKTKISIRLDNSIIEHFRRQVEDAGGGNYQTLINDALLAFIGQRSMLDAVRQVVREELHGPKAVTRQAKRREPVASSKVNPFTRDFPPVERSVCLEVLATKHAEHAVVGDRTRSPVTTCSR